MSRDEALSIFGILSGMTMSFLMFPGTLTNSLSVLLLPAVSEASARDNRRGLARSLSLNKVEQCHKKLTDKQAHKIAVDGQTGDQRAEQNDAQGKPEHGGKESQVHFVKSVQNAGQGCEP